MYVAKRGRIGRSVYAPADAHLPVQELEQWLLTTNGYAGKRP